MSGLNGTIGVDITSRYSGSGAFSAARADMRGLKDEAAGMSSAANAAAGSLGGIGKMFSALQLDKVVDGMIAFHKEALAQVGTYQKIADGLGVNVELWQAYRLAAREAGVDQETLNGALSRFNATLGSAAGGNAQAIASFKSIGVNILDANGKLRGSSEILTEVARATTDMGNNARQAAAGVKFFGESGSNLAPLLKSLSTDADTLTDGFKRQGMIVDEQTTKTLKRLADSSDTASEKLKALYATVAAPIQATALDMIGSAAANLVTRIRTSRASLVELLSLAAQIPANPLAGGIIAGKLGAFGSADPERALGDKIAQKNKELDDLNRRMNEGAFPISGPQRAKMEAQGEAIREQTAQLQVQLQTIRDARAAKSELDRVVNDGLPAANRFQTAGASNPTPEESKRGGFGGERDRIGENLRQLEGERKAIEDALGRLQQSSNVPLRELERTVEVQRRIDEMVARATKTDAGDKRAQEIRAAATALEQSRYGYQEYLRALSDAESFQARFGNGQRELEETERRLAAARDTGRLTLDAYTIALRQANEASEVQRLAMIGQRGGLEGMAAGFQSAAMQYAKQNDAFNTGARFFSDTTQLMTESFRQWRQTGQLDMGQFLASWSDMLLQMVMQASAAQAFKALGGEGGGGLLSGLAGLVGRMFGFGSSGAGSIGSGISGAASMVGFADGGRPPVGQVSMVGERGPEPFIPDTAGTIIPNEIYEAARGGRGVTIHQTFQISTGVQSTVRAEILSLMPAISKATVAAVNDARNRTGDRR